MNEKEDEGDGEEGGKGNMEGLKIEREKKIKVEKCNKEVNKRREDGEGRREGGIRKWKQNGNMER